MKLQSHYLAFALSLFFLVPTGQDVRTLEPGKAVEREIAGGQSLTYQIQLAAGQFVRFHLDQQAIDATLVLTAPDGKQLVEMDMTAAGVQESLSLEAAATGSYGLTIRAKGTAALRGAYRLVTVVTAQATAQDRQRLKAETLWAEALKSNEEDDKPEQAINKLEQSLPIWREVNEPACIGYTLIRIGAGYRDLRQFEKAFGFLEQALTISREAKLRALEGATLGALGDASYVSRKFEQAIAYYEQGLPIRREVKDRLGEARSLQGLGVVYLTMRRAEKALEYYRQAQPMFQEVEDRLNEAETFFSTAVANNLLSRTEAAIAANGQSLAIARELKNQGLESRVLLSLGVISMTVSRFEKAIEYFEQVVSIAREAKNRDNEAFALNGLGGAYNSLQRFDKAIEYSEQALVIARKTNNKFIEGQVLLYLGGTYSALNQFDKANEYLEQALQRGRELKYAELEGKTLAALGGAAIKQGRPEKAIEYYEQALTNFRDLKNRPMEGNGFIKLGEIYRSLGQYEKAIESTQKGLLIVREVKNPEFEVSALSTLARTESARNHLAQARSLAEEGLRIAEQLRTEEINDPTSRATFLANIQNFYQLYTDVLMRQHKADPTKGFDALAVETSERQRARSLLDQLSESRIDVREGVDPTLLERERTLAKQLNDKARTPASTPEQRATLKREISQLETDLERAQAVIRNANPHYAALVQPQPLKLREIQQQLDADTLLLEYAFGEQRSYLWAITRDTVASYELPKGEQIKQSALAVYELLTARSTTKRGESALERQQRINHAETQLSAAAQTLSQMVLAPVAAQLGSKRLVIVADGALQYIPFAMLPDPNSQESSVESRESKRNSDSRLQTPDSKLPLIVNHEVVSLPSASALAIQRTELAGRQAAPKLLAVIADPVFDRSDRRFKSAAPEASDQSRGQARSLDDERKIAHLVDKSADQSGVTTRQLVIPRLPFTRQEATRLLALTPKNSSFSAIDFQASRETVLKGDLSQYRYVHFATHGLLDSERPGLSSLVLSMVDEQGKAQDGFLRANDIYNLKLPADLVVLSACQTGLGQEIKGEGLVGLTRGFMYAGAARVVVSLWSVNDKATAELMTKFYEKMVKQGERPAAALRAAQVEIWKQKQWQSPYYWAAFTLQGEWR